MVKKVSMYVGPHDVYQTIDVNFSILTRECKNKKLVDNIFSSNFVWPRRLRIKRYHARFRAIMVIYIYIYKD